MSREVMQQALEALGKAKRQIVHANVAPHGCIDEAITAIKEALAQPEQPKQPEEQPAFYGFMVEEECCVNICYSPAGPGGPNNELPTAYYASPPQRQPLKRATIADAPGCLNTNDKAMWVIGWNECVEAHGIGDKT